MSQYRLPMPIFSPSERFNPSVTHTKDVVKALYGRAMWWLSTRSAAEVDEEYVDMRLYLWVQPTDIEGEYTAHLAMSDVSLADIPEDAYSTSFPDAWTLRGIEAEMQNTYWPKILHLGSRGHFRQKCGLNSTLDDLRDVSDVVSSRLQAPGGTEDFDTDFALYGADRFTLFFDFDDKRWSYQFDVPELAEMNHMKGCARYVTDLRDYGVITHQDAIDFLETEEYDNNLKVIALVHDMNSINNVSSVHDMNRRH